MWAIYSSICDNNIRIVSFSCDFYHQNKITLILISLTFFNWQDSLSVKFPQKSSYKSLQINVSFFSSAQLPLFLGAYRASLSKSDRILLRIIYQHDFPFENGVPLQVVLFLVKLPDDYFYKRNRLNYK